MSGFSDIFAENASKYSHLQFGEEAVAGVVFIREEFKIPKEEEILVFAPAEQTGNNGSSFGVTITDSALYVHPQMALSFHENRIILQDLTKYLFFQEDSYDAVHALSLKEDRVIFPKTSGKRNETGRELLRLLKIFQNNLITVNQRSAKEYDAAVASAISFARASFVEHGVLTVRAQMLLNIVENEGKFPVDVTFLRAENLYRLSDMARYYSFLDEMTGKVNDDLIKRLKNPDEAFFDDFVRDISNPYSLFLTQDLLPSYANLRRLSALNEFQTVLLCYLCVRTDDELCLHRLLTERGRDIGEKQLWEIMSFQARFRNEKMASIYNRILSSANVSPTEQHWVDSLGLTALHYAILLRNRKEINAILTSGEWSSFNSPYADEDLKSLYDFSFLASVVYDNPQDVREIFLKTSNLVKPIQKAIGSLEQKIYINRELGRLDQVKEYEEKKRDMEKEIGTLLNAFLARSKNKAEKIRETGSPFAKFLLSVYENNDALFHILTGTISDYRIYRFDRRFFVATVDTDLPFSFYEYKDQVFSEKNILFGDDEYTWTVDEKAEYERLNKKEEEKKQERTYRKYSFTGEEDSYEETVPYRDPQSWFSEVAKYDPDVLKKEFRVLVKKYHPDNSDIPQAALLLQQIMSEHEKLLSSMGRK